MDGGQLGARQLVELQAELFRSAHEAPYRVVRVAERHAQRHQLIGDAAVVRLRLTTVVRDGVGVDARAAGIDFSVLLARAQGGDFDGLLLAWGIDTSLDISYAFETGSPQNWGAYADSALDRMFGEFERATSAEAALPIVHRIERRVHDEQPYTFLWEAQRIDASHRRLTGVAPNALSAFANLREWGVVAP